MTWTPAAQIFTLWAAFLAGHVALAEGVPARLARAVLLLIIGALVRIGLID